MTWRNLFQEIMRYGTFDRMPVIHWGTWGETARRWEAEGMPEGLDRDGQRAFFDAVPQWVGVGVNGGLFPVFEKVVVEETDEYRLFWDTDGVLQKHLKGRGAVPHYIDFRLKTADDWPEFKRRLQPDPGRVPSDLDAQIAAAEASGAPVVVGVASMMGWIRNWMGVERMAYLMYDAPDVYADMVETLADLSCWALDQVVPRMTRPPDMVHSWEDICGSTGPFVSPPIFERCVAPGYRKVRGKLAEHGVEFYVIDSDGKVGPLVGPWLEAGVNVQFPVEPGTWGETPEVLKKRFGKRLRIIGGFDKLALEKGREAIDGEIARRVDLCREGGYVMMPDHLITPGVALDDYRYYLDRIRELRF